MPGVLSETWYGLMAPAGTPTERILLLHRALSATLARPEVRQRLAEQGGRIVDSDPEGFARHIHAEYAAMAEVTRRAGMKLE